MSDSKSSGIYVIDSEYNIVSFNQRAKEIYPMLRTNEKCYKVLMNDDKPCAHCPVYHQVEGPHNYQDPIHHINSVMEAAEIPLSDGSIGYALVFSDLAEKAQTKNRQYSHRRTLLVVEDNELNRDMLRSFLEEDYDIIEARDGNEGLAMLNAYYQGISVVLLDLVMPNCTGFEFLERIRNRPPLSNVPVIVMTGITDTNAEERCLKLGAVDFIQKPYMPALMKSRIMNTIRMHESAESLSIIEVDELTGLYTRQAFFHHARQLIDSHPDASFDVLIVDIENFKHVNSSYGENKGNEVLQSLAEFMRARTPDGLCARYGADLFVGIYPALEKGRKACAKEHIDQYTAQAPVPNLVIKCGIYQHVDRKLSISQMCDRAYLALKSIKRNHNRSVALFDGPVSQYLLKSQSYESAFQSALARKEFVIYYQPKYNPYTQKIVGVEALVRWKHNGRMMPPGDFLPIFEEDGLICKLDEYVFRTVCEYQRSLKQLGKTLIPISVNISRRSMYQPDVVKRYQQIVADNGISPSDVPIEITESAAIGSKEIKPLADAFTEVGFSLHMDDFGSGHSSLNDLNVLHFDVVKIDKNLIDHIGDRRGELLLLYTMALGKELGMYLVAEGVENEEQLNFLMKNGCDAIQGYYYSKPLPMDEFEEKILGNREQKPAFAERNVGCTVLSEDCILKRTIDRMLLRMPGGFLTYRAGGEEQILSSNPYLWNLFGFDNEKDFMAHVGGSFKGIVCPEELESVEESIREQIASSIDEMDYVEYHIVRKDGTRVGVVDYGHLDHQEDGDVFYVFIIEATSRVCESEEFVP